MTEKKSKTKETLVIQGGTPLYGSVRVGGAKNASYKLMIASLLGSGENRLLNLSRIADVAMTIEIIRSLGAQALYKGERALFIDPQGLNKWELDEKYGIKSRASTMFIPVLLAKFGKARVPQPGGDKIGVRPLERHWAGLEAMGATIQQKEGWIEAKASKGLHGTNYRFDKNTHTGTETLLMAAVMAKGTTVLENAAEEPEIDDLISLLNKMGARIRRRSFRTIEIEGVEKLSGAIHRVMPDRNEMVSYACAAIASKGDVIVENAQPELLQAFLRKLDEIGAGYEAGDYGMRFFYKGPLRPTDVETQIHPGFMTDWQPLWATLISHAQGDSIIHETVMQNRFQYVDQLRQMGAKIEDVATIVQDPENFYNFNLEDKKDSDVHAIRISGPTQFIGQEMKVHDLRAGATLILAALSAKGETVLHNVNQIDRGYEKLPEKLVSMGAKIKRV